MLWSIRRQDPKNKKEKERATVILLAFGHGDRVRLLPFARSRVSGCA